MMGNLSHWVGGGMFLKEIVKAWFSSFASLSWVESHDTGYHVSPGHWPNTTDQTVMNCNYQNHTHLTLLFIEFISGTSFSNGKLVITAVSQYLHEILSAAGLHNGNWILFPASKRFTFLLPKPWVSGSQQDSIAVWTCTCSHQHP